MSFVRVAAAFVAGQGAQDDVEIPIAKHLRGRIRVAVKGDIFDEFVDHLEADLLVRFLAATKAQFDPDFHIVAKELDGMVPLHCEVVRIDGGRDLKLFHFVGGRALRLFAALGLFVEEFSVIYDAADRGRGVGRDLDEVQAFGLSQAKSFVQGHYTELLFGLVYDPDFPGADFTVSAVQRFTWTEGTGEERAAQ